MYVSPVVGPEQKATIGGVGIDALYAGVAPLDFGTGWTFFTYNGKVNVICIADKGDRLRSARARRPRAQGARRVLRGAGGGMRYHQVHECA